MKGMLKIKDFPGVPEFMYLCWTGKVRVIILNGLAVALTIATVMSFLSGNARSTSDLPIEAAIRVLETQFEEHIRLGDAKIAELELVKAQFHEYVVRSESRMTRMEANSENAYWLLKVVATCVIGLLLNASWSLVRRRAVAKG